MIFTFRHPDGGRHLALRDTETLDEVLHEDLARVDRGDLVSGSQQSQPPPVRRHSI